jgi:hypothetical protein
MERLRITSRSLVSFAPRRVWGAPVRNRTRRAYQRTGATPARNVRAQCVAICMFDGGLIEADATVALNDCAVQRARSKQ